MSASTKEHWAARLHWVLTYVSLQVDWPSRFSTPDRLPHAGDGGGRDVVRLRTPSAENFAPGQNARDEALLDAMKLFCTRSLHVPLITFARP